MASTIVPANASLEDKVDIVLDLLVKQSVLLTKSWQKIEELEKENATMRTTISTLSREVHSLKNSSNRREQLLLSNSIRIFGVSIGDDEPNATDGGKALAGKIYDKVLKPVLLAAKIKGTNASNVIESCYRAGKPSSDKSRPPPVVVKLCSQALRLAILQNKKDGLVPPSEADQRAGIKRYTVAEDLTGDTFKCLRALSADPRVAKVWTIDGHLRFTLVDVQIPVARSKKLNRSMTLSTPSFLSLNDCCL
jgi:hypothetical protein